MQTHQSLRPSHAQGMSERTRLADSREPSLVPTFSATVIWESTVSPTFRSALTSPSKSSSKLSSRLEQDNMQTSRSTTPSTVPEERGNAPTATGSELEDSIAPHETLLSPSTSQTLSELARCEVSPFSLEFYLAIAVIPKIRLRHT